MPEANTSSRVPRLDDERGGYRLAESVTGLSRAALYSAVSRRMIPHYRVGRRTVIFSRIALEKWLEDGRVQTGHDR